MIKNLKNYNNELNIYIPLQDFISKLVNGLNICNVKGKGKGCYL